MEADAPAPPRSNFRILSRHPGLSEQLLGGRKDDAAASGTSPRHFSAGHGESHSKPKLPDPPFEKLAEAIRPSQTGINIPFHEMDFLRLRATRKRLKRSVSIALASLVYEEAGLREESKALFVERILENLHHGLVSMRGHSTVLDVVFLQYLDAVLDDPAQRGILKQPFDGSMERSFISALALHRPNPKKDRAERGVLNHQSQRIAQIFYDSKTKALDARRKNFFVKRAKRSWYRVASLLSGKKEPARKVQAHPKALRVHIPQSGVLADFLDFCKESITGKRVFAAFAAATVMTACTFVASRWDRFQILTGSDYASVYKDKTIGQEPEVSPRYAQLPPMDIDPLPASAPPAASPNDPPPSTAAAPAAPVQQAAPPPPPVRVASAALPVRTAGGAPTPVAVTRAAPRVATIRREAPRPEPVRALRASAVRPPVSSAPQAVAAPAPRSSPTGRRPLLTDVFSNPGRQGTSAATSTQSADVRPRP